MLWRRSVSMAYSCSFSKAFSFKKMRWSLVAGLLGGKRMVIESAELVACSTKMFTISLDTTPSSKTLISAMRKGCSAGSRSCLSRRLTLRPSGAMAMRSSENPIEVTGPMGVWAAIVSVHTRSAMLLDRATVAQPA